MDTSGSGNNAEQNGSGQEQSSTVDTPQESIIDKSQEVTTPTDIPQEVTTPTDTPQEPANNKQQELTSDTSQEMGRKNGKDL